MSAAAAPALPPWLAVQLKRLLAQRGHAWLLQGPSGLGQAELGLALVRAWLCEQPSEEGACDHCTSCHAIDVHTHADLAVLMPETELLARGWPLSEKAQADIDDKKRKPSQDIRVEALREAIEFAQRTSARGRGLAVLIYPAERMNTVAANALLKTLEEPPGDVRFVLASDAAQALPATIRSRCQTHTLAWPDPAQAQRWLVGQGLSEPDAAVLLRAAGGRPADALSLAQALGAQPATAWAALPKAIARGEGATALAGQPLGWVIGVLQKICHDLLAQASGAAPRFFDAADLPPVPQGPAALEALTAWAAELRQAARTADHPFQPGLALEAQAARALKALHFVPSPVSRP